MRAVSMLQHVLAACDAARRHADMSISLFDYISGGADVEAVRQEHRLLGQTMRREINKAKGPLGEEDRGAELLDALGNMSGDAEETASWSLEERSRLAGLMADPVVYRDALYGAHQECACRRRRVFESARLAEESARRITEGRVGEEGKATPPAGAAGDNVSPASGPTDVAPTAEQGPEPPPAGPPSGAATAEEASPNGADSAACADSGADGGAKKQKTLPDNIHVLRLAQRIKRSKGAESLMDIARAYVIDEMGQDDPKHKIAQNLLRQIRRYPHLIE
jgi:hypothetical protein